MKACIVIAVLIALFRPLMLFHEFSPTVITLYKDFAHVFLFGLFGFWVGRANIHQFKEQHAEKFSTIPLIMRWMFDFGLGLVYILFSPFMGYCRPYDWAIHTVTYLTWVEIICFGLSRLL